MSIPFILALSLAGRLLAAAPETDPQKLYAQGDYKAAAAAYRQMTLTAPRDSGAHYNLGNALFKGGETGRAIAAYQRAFDMSPRDPDIRQNLDFALRRAGEELIPAGMPPLLFIVFHAFSESELAGLQWLACWATLILAGLLLYRQPWREPLWPWAALAAALWLGTGSWWLALQGLTPSRRGVIAASAAEIRSGPGDNFNVSFTSPEGRRVEIFSDNGDWLEIGITKEGVKGWIRAGSVEKI